jgi:hypothetical protein
VDDLLVNCVVVKAYLQSVYKKIKVNSGKVLNYTGMTLDFTVRGQVSITMVNCITDIITTSVVTEEKKTPATGTLFDVRESSPKATVEEATCEGSVRREACAT